MRLVRIGAFIALSIVLLSMLLYLIFRFNKASIERELLRIAHTYQSGEITVKDIDLSLFAQFPKVSLKLESVTYFEHLESKRKVEELPVAQLENIYVTVEILKLIKGDIVVTELTLKKGRINIIKYQDKSINLLNAVGIGPGKSKKTPQAMDQPSESVLNLDVLTLEDVHLSYENADEDYQVDVLINQLRNSLSLEGPYLNCQMVSDIILLGLQTQGRTFLKNIDVGMELDFRFDLENSIGQIAPSELRVENAFIGVEGSIDLKDDGFLDLKFDSLINDVSLLSLVFEEEVLSRNKANLTEGEVFLKGNIKGKFRDHFPPAEFTFGANNVHLDVPEGSGPIEGLRFKGSFATGEAQDLSEAVFKLEDLNAVLPGGSLKGSVEVHNLARPEISLQCDAKADIRGFDTIFKVDFVKGLRGVLTIKAELTGVIDSENNRMSDDSVESRVSFENVAFSLPRWQTSIDSLNGAVRTNKDSLIFKDIIVRTGGSDLLINGDTSGLIAYLRGRKTGITADVRLKSDMLKLSEVLAFNPSLAESSDEEISGLEADINISTSTDGMVNHSPFPLGTLGIKSLSAELKNYEDIKTLSGSLVVKEDLLLVRGLDAKIGDSDIRLSADLSNPQGLSNKETPVDMSLGITLDSSLLRVRDVLVYRGQTYFLDSLKDDSFSNLHFKGEVEINNQELFGKKVVPSFHLKVDEVDWSLAAFPNPFEDLIADISFQDEDLVIRNIQGRFGENDFAIDGIFDHFLYQVGEGDLGKSTTLHLRSHNLNLSEIDDLIASSVPEEKEKEKEESSWDFPPLHLSLDIDSLKWRTLSARNVTGELNTRGISKLVLNSQDESFRGRTVDDRGYEPNDRSDGTRKRYGRIK